MDSANLVQEDTAQVKTEVIEEETEQDEWKWETKVELPNEKIKKEPSETQKRENSVRARTTLPDENPKVELLHVRRKRTRIYTDEQKAKKRERMRQLRAKQTKDGLCLESEKTLWRRRIREGDPLVTPEKLAELKEEYGMDTDKLWNNFQMQLREEMLKNREQTGVTETEEEFRKKWFEMKTEERRQRRKRSEEQLRLEAEKQAWRRKIREHDPSITQEKLVEIKEKYGMNVEKIWESYDPERREKRLRHKAEQRRMKQEMIREVKNNPEEALSTETFDEMSARGESFEAEEEEEVQRDIEKKRKKALENRIRYHALSEEKRKEKAARYRFKKLEKQLQMTEEEKEQHRMKQYLARQVYYAKHGRYYEKSREEKDKRNAQNKIWRENLPPEKKKRLQESLRRAQKKCLEKLKATDPQNQCNNYCTAYWNKVKREDPERWREYREKMKEYQRKKYRNETEEERRKRRYKDKVNGVKRQLKKELEQEGVEAGEIEKRLNEVHEQMWKEFDPEWTWEKFRKRARVQKKVESSGETSAAATNIYSGRLDVNVNQLKTEVLESSLTPPSIPLRRRLPKKPSYTNTNPQLPLASQVSSTSFECVQVETSFEFDSHNWEPDETDGFCPSPSSPPPPSPDPIQDASFQETSSLSSHDSCPVTATFKCTFCKFESFEDCYLRDHIRASHPDKVWKCPICKAVVLSQQELSSHFQSAHNAPSKPQTPNRVGTTSSNLNFFCMRCCPVEDGIVGFPTRLELFAHVKKKHGRLRFWPCNYCFLLKYSQDNLQVHQTMCTKMQRRGHNQLGRGRGKR